MTVHIGPLTTEIDGYDAHALRTMAHRVVQDRPSFRRVLARIGDETVEIYTMRRRAGQRLRIDGPHTRLEIDAKDRRTLYGILADMN